MSIEYLDRNPEYNNSCGSDRLNIKRDIGMIAMVMAPYNPDGFSTGKTEMVTAFDNSDGESGMMEVAETIIPTPDKIAENLIDFAVKEFSNAGKLAAGIIDGDIEIVLNNATSLVGEAVLTIGHESPETAVAKRLSANAKQEIINRGNASGPKSKYTLAA